MAENNDDNGVSFDRDPSLSPLFTAREIRDRAYDIWERNHRPEGFEMQFWLAAERELKAERAARSKEDLSPSQ